MKTDVRTTIPPLVLITANALVFFLSLVRPGLEESFAMSVRTVFADGEYLRLLKYMFMHAGWQHLASNMLLLFFISKMNLGLQSVTKYAVTYFAAGILGGLAELFLRNQLNLRPEIAAVGASGAIMGLVGSTLALFLIKKQRIPAAERKNTILRLVLLAALNMVPTRGDGVDYLGHLTGFLVGALVTAVLSLGSVISPSEQDLSDPRFTD